MQRTLSGSTLASLGSNPGLSPSGGSSNEAAGSSGALIHDRELTFNEFVVVFTEDGASRKEDESEEDEI
jgi:hypothetical protein